MEPFVEKSSDTPDNPRLFFGCPFLGIKDDPQSYFSTPDRGNYCFKVKPPRLVASDYQTNFCLTDQYKQCKVFTKGRQEQSQQLIRGVEATKSLPVKAEDTVIEPVVLQDVVKQVEADEQLPLDKEPVNEPDLISTGEMKTSKKRHEAVKEPAAAITWKQLHEDAKNQYKKEKPRWNRRPLRVGLVAISGVVLLIFALWLFSKFGDNQARGELALSAFSTQPVIAAEDQSDLEQTAVITEETALALDGDKPSPQPTSLENENEVEYSETPIIPAISQPTATRTDVCSDQSGYPVEVLSGPELSPKPGYIYRIGSPEPFFQASWVIKNPGTCKWEEFVLKEIGAVETITIPIIKRNGETVDLEDLEQAIVPGDQIEIILRYRAKEAGTISQKWVIKINGFELPDVAPLELTVENWVTIVRDTDKP